ncbi:hypothetical protein O0I10_011957 [Lichtheimia ornata]|uniref:Uncharacterized protein n=1 Tax=Lichtheimia ornata TaxID=688661 RepID=A0AAD7UTY5_9FUNG|nr:uncharacterized protein O0I10_011957 [Lichtheimia ornata]KAJ8652425.1 hypothetical protein O0I10_011957 [Lichtheimia ornata]
MSNQDQTQNNHQEDVPMSEGSIPPSAAGSAFTPDMEDARQADISGQLGVDATPQQVMQALANMIQAMDITITDLATGDNQHLFQEITRQRDEYAQRLAVLQRINAQETAQQV